MSELVNPEYVAAPKHLICGRYCPRCLQEQKTVRRHRGYEGRSGTILIFSCKECKRVIGLDIEETKHAGTNDELSHAPRSEGPRA